MSDAELTTALERIKELTEASAPSLPTILRYNERVATVFSYVSQVIRIPDTSSLMAMEQRGIHKMLKLPPNSMSRTMAHSFGNFCAVVPKAIAANCRATMYRFALRELS